MFHYLTFLLLGLFQICSINGLVPINGTCSKVPKVPRVDNFDIGKFSGVWWRVASYEVNFGTCGRLKYIKKNATNFVELRDQILPNGTHFNGIAYGGPSADPTATYDARGKWIDGREVVSPHWVVGVDYKNWCVLWLCIGNSGGAYIFSRQEALPKQYEATVYNLFDKAGFNRTLLQNITNFNCPVFD